MIKSLCLIRGIFNKVKPDRPTSLNGKKKTISQISGSSLTVSSPFNYLHEGARNVAGALEFLPHVANLTRNIILHSANANGTRGHVVFSDRANVDIRFAAFKDMGRTTTSPLDRVTNHIGRYALHMHRLSGPTSPQAYATVGDGPPLVKAANWLNHLEYDWQSPVWSHLLKAIAAKHRLIRYDERGNGLSDWDVDEISLDAFIRDLETVVDANGLERFPLLGVSQGCAVSIAYAARHPERVSHLVLYGGYARGRRKRGQQAEIDQADALLTLMRQGWGQENPAFRQIFTSLFIPDATAEQAQWFNDLQRVTTSPENAARIRYALDNIDVSPLLTSIRVPTLVLHCRNDAVQPFEEGRRMAAGIAGSRFVALEVATISFSSMRPPGAVCSTR